MRCCFWAAGQIKSHDACSLSAASPCLTGGPFRRKREPSASASVGEQEGGDEPGRGRRWAVPAHGLIAHAPARLTRRLPRFLLCGQGLQETASTACLLRPAERPVVLLRHLLPVEGPPGVLLPVPPRPVAGASCGLRPSRAVACGRRCPPSGPQWPVAVPRRRSPPSPPSACGRCEICV